MTYKLGLHLFQPFIEHILCPLLSLFWLTDRGRTDKISGSCFSIHQVKTGLVLIVIPYNIECFVLNLFLTFHFTKRSCLYSFGIVKVLFLSLSLSLSLFFLSLSPLSLHVRDGLSAESRAPNCKKT